MEQMTGIISAIIGMILVFFLFRSLKMRKLSGYRAELMEVLHEDNKAKGRFDE